MIQNNQIYDVAQTKNGITARYRLDYSVQPPVNTNFVMVMLADATAFNVLGYAYLHWFNSGGISVNCQLVEGTIYRAVLCAPIESEPYLHALGWADFEAEYTTGQVGRVAHRQGTRFCGDSISQYWPWLPGGKFPLDSSQRSIYLDLVNLLHAGSTQEILDGEWPWPSGAAAVFWLSTYKSNLTLLKLFDNYISIVVDEQVFTFYHDTQFFNSESLVEIYELYKRDPAAGVEVDVDLAEAKVVGHLPGDDFDVGLGVGVEPSDENPYEIWDVVQTWDGVIARYRSPGVPADDEAVMLLPGIAAWPLTGPSGSVHIAAQLDAGTTYELGYWKGSEDGFLVKTEFVAEYDTPQVARTERWPLGRHRE